MPKTNDATGATYAGQDGIVEDAVGKLSQLDPSRNLDGSVVDGFASDERDIEPDDVNEKDLRADSTTAAPVDEDDEDEVKSSGGSSSTTSSQSNAKTSAKPQSRLR